MLQIALALLIAASSLLSSVTNSPDISPAIKEQATTVAHTAIDYATMALQSNPMPNVDPGLPQQGIAPSVAMPEASIPSIPLVATQIAFQNSQNEVYFATSKEIATTSVTIIVGQDQTVIPVSKVVRTNASFPPATKYEKDNFSNMFISDFVLSNSLDDFNPSNSAGINFKFVLTATDGTTYTSPEIYYNTGIVPRYMK